MFESILQLIFWLTDTQQILNKYKAYSKIIDDGQSNISPYYLESTYEKCFEGKHFQYDKSPY